MSDPTGLTEVTPQKMQLNAGVFLENFTIPASVVNAETFRAHLESVIEARTGLLGATRGGGTFVAVPEVREPEIDGKRYRTKGLILYDSWDVRLTTTLVEAYAGNFKRGMGSADLTESGRVETLALRTALANSDYIDHLSWVSMLGDGTYVVIELDNVVNLDGVTFTFADKSEGTIPVNFAATQGSLTGTENAPFRIKYFYPNAIASHINVYSVEGSASGKTVVTVTPQKTTGQSYKYKTAEAVAIPATDEVLTTGWNAWDGSAEITATAGNEIVVAVVTTADNKCVAAGKTLVVTA